MMIKQKSFSLEFSNEANESGFCILNESELKTVLMAVSLADWASWES